MEGGRGSRASHTNLPELGQHVLGRTQGCTRGSREVLQLRDGEGSALTPNYRASAELYHLKPNRRGPTAMRAVESAYSNSNRPETPTAATKSWRKHAPLEVPSSVEKPLHNAASTPWLPAKCRRRMPTRSSLH